MKNQTSIEWLVEQLGLAFELENYQSEINQAKEMEKEQIFDAWDVAHQAGRFEGKGIAEENWQTSEQYYNETFKSE